MLRIQLLGSFSLRQDDRPITSLNTPRLRSLLAYLLLHAGTPQARQHIAFVLWPDTPESHARNNLRQFLYQLRQILPDSDRFLVTDANTVSWKKDSTQILDVDLFEQALAAVALAGQRDNVTALRKNLERALSYYQGDLLPECYDDWIVPERERLRQECQLADQKLVHVLEAQHEYAVALQTGEQLLRLNPLDEETYVTLMRLHVLNNDRPGARRVYQTAVQTFQRELGIEPGEALRQALRQTQAAPTVISQSVASQLTPTPTALVGRQPEWRQLLAAWQRAASGESLFTLITGEAGIGKSRLAEELFNWVRQQGLSAAHTRSYAAEGRLSLTPVTEWLRSDTLRSCLTTLNDVWLIEVARVLPELLIEHTDLPRPEPIAEYGQRQRFFEALVHAVFTTPLPLLLWIDDLQWSDPETLDWLHFLLRYEPRHPVLVLGTARSEESSPDHPLSALAQQLRMENSFVRIELSALDASETAKLASQIQGSEPDMATAIRLYHETEGNPLFVVETVRAGLGATETTAPAGSAPHTLRETSTLPPRVYALMAGRLAQLSPSARKIAELGAAIGHAFTLETLMRAGHGDEDHVIAALDELWQKRVLYQSSANFFDFTHDKLRDVAYAETSPPQRLLLHHRIAQALETSNADHLDPVSAEIAAQYEQAGLFDQALPYYRRAGTVAANVYANDDAINLLSRGLALLARFPPGVKRDEQELSFQLALSPLYRITKGWASAEVEQTLNRARFLSDQIGNVTQRIQTLYGLQALYVVQAHLEKVQSTYDEMRELLMQTQDRLPPFAGLHCAGAKLHMGHFGEAHQQFEETVAVRDDSQLLSLQKAQGMNYLAHGHAWNSHALWCLGYPQQALASAATAVQLAREFAQPFNQALAVTYLALLQELCADVDTFQRQAQQAFVLTREYQAPYYHAWASILVHFAEAWQKPNVASVASLRKAIRAFVDSGAHLRMPYYLSLLARAYYRAGQPDEGLSVLDQAMAASEQNSERWWDAELERLRGELLWAQNADTDQIQAAFQSAIEIAQAQPAKSLELRAAMSLARWWQAHSRSAEAKQLLVPLYGWFTEGFDTPDLQAAQALITSL
jgi:DNA-binding SARP family transcriptional activator/predicted ATPase